MNIIVNKITTAVSCINTNRNYIGFELDKDYYNSSLERIEQYLIEEEQKMSEFTEKLNSSELVSHAFEEAK